MDERQYPKGYLYRRIVQAKIFIDQHYADDIDLDNISDEAYFSKFHFIRLFKKAYGKTPHQYLISVRIDHAKLLLQEQKPVSDVCFQIGFSSISSFTGLFKKMVGQTPSEYSFEQKRRQENIQQKPLGYIPGCWAEMEGWKEKSNFQEVE